MDTWKFEARMGSRSVCIRMVTRLTCYEAWFHPKWNRHCAHYGLFPVSAEQYIMWGAFESFIMGWHDIVFVQFSFLGRFDLNIRRILMENSDGSGMKTCTCLFLPTYPQRDYDFYDLLTVHLGSILVNNQLDAQFFFHIYLFQFSTCFKHPCAHHQENQLY